MNEQQGATQRCQVWDENEEEKTQTGGEETPFLTEKRRRRSLTLKSEREKKGMKAKEKKPLETQRKNQLAFNILT